MKFDAQSWLKEWADAGGGWCRDPDGSLHLMRPYGGTGTCLADQQALDVLGNIIADEGCRQAVNERLAMMCEQRA